MKRGTPEHPKTTNLMRRLQVARYQAVGILESLWHFTMRYAPAGDVGKWSNDEIASAIGWEGNAEVLVAALLATKWLDAGNGKRLIVHDWHEHADQTCKRYIASHNLAFASMSLANDSPPVPDPVPDPVPVPDPDTEETTLPATAGLPVDSRAKLQTVADAWNALGPPFPGIRKLTDKRRRLLKARLGEKDWDWEEALKAIPDQAFLRGETDRGNWIANFDWFIKSDSVTKVLEGQYAGSSKPKPDDDDPWLRDNPTPTSEELRARGLFPMPEDGDSE